MARSISTVLEGLILPALLPLSHFVKAAVDLKIQERNAAAQEYQFQETLRQQRLLHADNKRFQEQQFDRQKELQWSLVDRQFKQQLELATLSQENALRTEEYKRILDNNVLKIVPGRILEMYRQFCKNNDIIPLLVLLSPPEIDAENVQVTSHELPTFEKSLEEDLRVLTQRYKNDHRRPIEFLGGAWNSKRFRNEAAISQLHLMFESIPTLILESYFDAKNYYLHAAFWWMGQKGVTHRPILSKFPFVQVLDEFAKADALQWKADKEKYAQAGVPAETVKEYRKDAEHNLKTLEEEEMSEQIGISNAQFEYIHGERHYREFEEFVLTCHRLVTICVADSYYLINYKLPPLFPALLPNLLPAFRSEALTGRVLGTIVSVYKNILKSMEPHMSHWLPDLYLQLSQVLVSANAKAMAKEQLQLSLKSFLEKHPSTTGVAPQSGLETNDIVDGDFQYLKDVKECARLVDDAELLAEVASLSGDLSRRKIQGDIKSDTQGDSIFDAWG